MVNGGNSSELVVAIAWGACCSCMKSFQELLVNHRNNMIITRSSTKMTQINRILRVYIYNTEVSQDRDTFHIQVMHDLVLKPMVTCGTPNSNKKQTYIYIHMHTYKHMLIMFETMVTCGIPISNIYTVCIYIYTHYHPMIDKTEIAQVVRCLGKDTWAVVNSARSSRPWSPNGTLK